jgi:hypothetical protein
MAWSIFSFIMMIAGICFIVIGLVGDSRTLLYPGIIFILLNIAPVYKYIKKKLDR